MTRHSKNATAGPTYTYHEKTKDCKQSGYGTRDIRLSKDAIKVFKKKIANSTNFTMLI